MTSGLAAGGMLCRLPEPMAPPWVDRRLELAPWVVELKRVLVGIEGGTSGSGGVVSKAMAAGVSAGDSVSRWCSTVPGGQWWRGTNAGPASPLRRRVGDWGGSRSVHELSPAAGEV